MKLPLRTRILSVLRIAHLTVSDLCRILDSSDSAVRRNLDLLRADGAVDLFGIIPGENGRPQNLYASVVRSTVGRASP